MAKMCPETGEKVVYLTCQECETRTCISQPFACLIAGSRTFNDYELLKRKMDCILSKYAPNVMIVSGGAKGADALAERYAKEKGFMLKIMPADWETYGKSAGFRRNAAMHDFIAKYPHRGCVCFWDGISKGTEHNFKLAKDHDTQLRIIRFKATKRRPTMKKTNVLRKLQMAENLFAESMKIMDQLREKLTNDGEDEEALETFLDAVDDFRDGTPASEIYNTLDEAGLLESCEDGETAPYPSIVVDASYPRIMEIRIPLANDKTLIAYSSEADYGTYQAGISYGDKDGGFLHDIGFAEIPKGELAELEGLDADNDKIVVRSYEDETAEDFTRKTVFDPNKIPEQ